VPAFVDRGVSRGQRGGSPTAVNLSFLDRSHYFSFQVAPHLSSQGLSGPRYKPNVTQKKLVAPGIEPRTSGSAARNSDHWTRGKYKPRTNTPKFSCLEWDSNPRPPVPEPAKQWHYLYVTQTVSNLFGLITKQRAQLGNVTMGVFFGQNPIF
jgi:hypothetical protein